MANLSGIARPYAHGAFEYAHAKQQVAAWKLFLNMAGEIATQSAVIKLLANPAVSSEQAYSLFQDILANNMNVEQKNFLMLLTQHERLLVLPDIAALFNAYTAAMEKVSNVRIVSAFALEEVLKQKFMQAIQQRLQHEVTLQYEVDPAILGGAVIYIGDRVIDGSVRGKLTRLLDFSLR
jgi:F-type H+-transporting ATPase subunit delta